jgi:HSP20 family protein
MIEIELRGVARDSPQGGETMAAKGTKELMKVESPRYLSPIDEMERWFEEAWKMPFSLLRSRMWPETELREFDTAIPLVDIYEEGKELVMKADLPGWRKEDIEVNLAENALMISGEKKGEEKVEKGNYFMYERAHGSFYRRFELPYDVDASKVKAHFEDGVLEVRIPKSAEAESKTRKISIS